MKLSNIVSTSELARLDELNATVPGATMTGTAPAANAPGAPTAAPTQDPQTAAKAQAMAAMQVKQQRDSIQKQIKDIDEQIKQLNQRKAELQKSFSSTTSVASVA